jgi:hypothetical protein
MGREGMILVSDSLAVDDGIAHTSQQVDCPDAIPQGHGFRDTAPDGNATVQSPDQGGPYAILMEGVRPQEKGP